MIVQRSMSATRAYGPVKIVHVNSHALEIPASLDITRPPAATSHSVCIVEIETDNGLHGHGISSIGPVRSIAHMVDTLAAPSIVGMNPLEHEAIWDKLYWQLAPRGQTGVALHAIAAIDIALWDIKGHAFGQPVWRLLGGARSTVPTYTTFGFGFYDLDTLVEAASAWVERRGVRRLKMTVGNSALQRRDEPRPLGQVIREDIQRVRAVREAVGDAVELYLDANCSLDFYHADQLCRALKPLDITFFEEPVTQNDVRQMADLRSRHGIALACGQNEGLAFRFRDLLCAQAVDIIQPNVAITGGFTQCAKIAGMAAAFNVPIANGGAWPFANQHLQAGMANGSLVEYHYPSVTCCEQIYDGLAAPQDGWLKLPDSPGLGFSLKRDALGEFAIR
jgi:L-alanine-DL-glutamate epimerase-like enolase superfamily enzyme